VSWRRFEPTFICTVANARRSAGSRPFSTITARTTSGARIGRPDRRSVSSTRRLTSSDANQPSDRRITLAGIASGVRSGANRRIVASTCVRSARNCPSYCSKRVIWPAISARFSTSAETTWVSAMVFPDLDEIGVIISGQSADIHGVVCLRHNAGFSRAGSTNHSFCLREKSYSRRRLSRSALWCLCHPVPLTRGRGPCR
jgi:hypothetical protein